MEADQERIGGRLLKHVFLRLHPVDILHKDQRRRVILDDQDTASATDQYHQSVVLWSSHKDMGADAGTSDGGIDGSEKLLFSF